MTRLGALFLVALAVIAAGAATAHEVRPAYLDISQDRTGWVRVLWRQPTAGEATLPITPRLSSGWLAPETGARTVAEDSTTTRWAIRPPHAALEGQTLTIEGLDASITDVLVRVRYANAVEASQLIRPDRPQWRLPASSKPILPVLAYLQLGLTHIWTGIDHLAYLLGLMLLVTSLKALIKTVTAFTVAHSVTLSMSALGLINVPPAPVEAVIALSILAVAVELVRYRSGLPSLAQRQPWLIAFPFGLLHGLGFAGALSEVGLPPHDIPAALLSFNLGIEAGQMAFVLAVMAAFHGLALAAPRVVAWVRRALPYLIGSVASYWLIARTLAFL